jgi:tetratricopeptide (TPR) repeat protein
MFIVQVCDFPLNGQAFYRYHEPGRALSRCGAVVVDCDPLHRLLPLLADAADVLVLHVYDWEWIPVLRRRRALGRATVVEASDDYFDVQPWNPGSVAWADGLEREKLQQLLAEADAVQTTTEELARRWAPWARRVAVLANHLPEIPPLAEPPRRPLTVGWGGSGTHLADWYAVCPVLQAWLDDRPDVHFGVMTDEAARPFLRLPPERYHFRRPGSLAEYLAFLRTLDVGLAPLLPSDFSRGRSDLKYLEYAAHGVAGIYANRGPFRDRVRHGETGLLYETGEELRRHLDALATDTALRRRLRQAAHADFMANRRLVDHVGERLRLYRELGPAVCGQRELPAEVVAAATRDGNYLQLRPGAPERVLAAAIERPADAEALPALVRLMEQHPLYEAALQQLGHLLNEAGRTDAALEYLNRALGLNPHSPRALCEAARSLAAAGDPSMARQHLEHALELSPSYPLAWLRLLRLLRDHPDGDATGWAERALRRHPQSYAVALAALPLLPERDRAARLAQLIEACAPAPDSEERGPAVAAFARAVGETVGPRPDTAEALELLRRAARALPESASVAAWLGQALDLAGETEEAQQHYARALTLRRHADVYRREVGAEDASLRQCLIAAYARKWSATPNRDS